MLDALFVIYNLILGLFGFRLLAWTSSVYPRTGRVGAWALILVAALGVLLTLFFPMDPRGAPVTFAGTVHLILAGLTSLGTMAALLSIGLWLRKQPVLQTYARYTFISLALVLVSGGMAATSAAQASPYMGLFERMTIGSFLQWVFILALKTSRSGNERES